MSFFNKAERRKAFIKLAITGPSGAGKSFSALRLARGLVGPAGKIAACDTENGSLSLYSDRFGFDVVDMNPPFLISKYIYAITEAEKAGFDVLIIDSLTHAWLELLAKKEALDARGGNSFTNWASITKEHESLKAAILAAKIHIIACMRSKQDYVIEENSKGKSAPKKVGMAPIQRDGMEYEFTTVFDIALDHHFAVSKDRTGLFDGRMEVITEQTGEELAGWLAGGKAEAPPQQTPEQAAPASKIDKINKRLRTASQEAPTVEAEQTSATELSGVNSEII